LSQEVESINKKGLDKYKIKFHFCQMIPRHLAFSVEIYANQYPAIAIIGPRQSGKTTLARAVFPDYTYQEFMTGNLITESGMKVTSKPIWKGTSGNS